MEPPKGRRQELPRESHLELTQEPTQEPAQESPQEPSQELPRELSEKFPQGRPRNFHRSPLRNSQGPPRSFQCLPICSECFNIVWRLSLCIALPVPRRYRFLFACFWFGFRALLARRMLELLARRIPEQRNVFGTLEVFNF